MFLKVFGEICNLYVKRLCKIAYIIVAVHDMFESYVK